MFGAEGTAGLGAWVTRQEAAASGADRTVQGWAAAALEASRTAQEPGAPPGASGRIEPVRLDGAAPSWEEQLAGLRRRMEVLRDSGPMPDPLQREQGDVLYGQLREQARGLFEAMVAAYRGLCPEGYPLIDDNGITGTGGAIGIRFDVHHAFFFTYERVKIKQKKTKEEELQGLAGALGLVPRKRMPGDPLPRPKPSDPVRLAMIALRWDEHSGWQEAHRPLDPRWDEALLREHLAAFLVGIGYDLTVAAQVRYRLEEDEVARDEEDGAAEPPARPRPGWRMQVFDE